LRSLKNKKVDYIFIGSSRVENGIVPSIIYDKTRKEAINLGFQAAKLVDIYTLLQLIKVYNIQYDTLFVQVDYIYNIVDGHSTIFQYEMIPFIRENAIVKEYSDRFSDHPLATYYVPFYRYCNTDLKMGFREIFANLIDKQSNIIINKGYRAFQGSALKLEGALPDALLENNPTFDSIQSFSKQNHMKVVFYCAPFCQNNKNKDFTSKLKKKIPDFLDFSATIIEDGMFLNCNHLNDSGARRFTEIFTEELLLHKVN
jgi:hypothetical protein